MTGSKKLDISKLNREGALSVQMKSEGGTQTVNVTDTQELTVTVKTDLCMTFKCLLNSIL